MGVVYEAVQEPLGRRVALKLLRRELAEDASFAARFRREAELAASLGHPNIAQVMDFGVDDGWPFLVMDLPQGAVVKCAMSKDAADRYPDAVSMRQLCASSGWATPSRASAESPAGCASASACVGIEARPVFRSLHRLPQATH